MSDDIPEGPSIFTDFGIPTEQDWDAIIGEPPEWYFPLVGRIAVATGGLEREMAQTALHLLAWPEGQGGDLAFWLHSNGRLRTLLDAAKGLNADFDRLVTELPDAWSLRNQVVHVATGWNDWEGPDEPSGWHYDHPRSKQPVYLDSPATRPALQKVLETITDLDRRVWDLYRSLSEDAAP